MYHHLPSFLLGFHGCDRAVGELVLAGKAELSRSKNSYDWLGNGLYFWEQDPGRARQFAIERAANPRRGARPISDPFVIGAIIDPGRCLSLLETGSMALLQESYALLLASFSALKAELPKNIDTDGTGDVLLRHLDCAVIETLHAAIEQDQSPPFQTVRGPFLEGPPAFPGAAISSKNHIQICVRDYRCIKGYFRPREACN